MTATLPPVTPPISLDPSQQAAVDEMMRRKNVFLTGEAGCGKTTTVLAFIAAAVANGNKIDCTASTGIAAVNLKDHYFARGGININVNTIYRWAGIQLGPQGSETNGECLNRLNRDMNPPRGQAWERVRKCRTLIIDEISMVPGRLVSFLDFLFQYLRNDDRPFGGIQIIAVGDVLQLPPVSKSGLYDWCFQSPSWEAAGFTNCVLKTIHRQSDPQFIDLLNAIRVGKVSAAHSKLLSSRVALFPNPNILRLFTHRVQVDKWNTTMLESIDAPVGIFKMWGDCSPADYERLKKSTLSPETLMLKAGARVRVTKNIVDDDGGCLVVVNGALGTVQSWTDDCIAVMMDDGKMRSIFPFKWKNDHKPYKDAPGITQFPLVLSFASTIHACQGLSLDSALIDVRAAREPGQVYVSLSRVKTLEGLWLRDVFKGVFISEEAVRFMDGLR